MGRIFRGAREGRKLWNEGNQDFLDNLGFLRFLWRILDNDRECRSAIKSVDYFSKWVVVEDNGQAAAPGL